MKKKLVPKGRFAWRYQTLAQSITLFRKISGTFVAKCAQDASIITWIYMRQPRNKLEPKPAQPRYLLMELGVGYRLKAE